MNFEDSLEELYVKNYDRARGEKHEREIGEIEKALKEMGVEVKVFSSDRTHYVDSKNGDYSANSQLIDHKTDKVDKNEEDRFFVSCKSSKNFVGKYYSTIDRNGRKLFISAEHVKEVLRRAKELGKLENSAGVKGDPSKYEPEYQIIDSEGKSSDLGYRVRISKAHPISIEEFVKKMTSVS